MDETCFKKYVYFAVHVYILAHLFAWGFSIWFQCSSQSKIKRWCYFRRQSTNISHNVNYNCLRNNPSLKLSTKMDGHEKKDNSVWENPVQDYVIFSLSCWTKERTFCTIQFRRFRVLFFEIFENNYLIFCGYLIKISIGIVFLKVSLYSILSLPLFLIYTKWFLQILQL